MTPTNVRGLAKMSEGDRRWIPALCQTVIDMKRSELMEQMDIDEHDADSLKKWARATMRRMESICV